VSECELYAKVSAAQPIPQGVFLVPVELLDMRSGSSHVVPGQPSHVEPLRRGVLMPAYAATLARFPAPMSVAIALEVASRLVPTLHFVHASGWLHGDVKPGNIFLDFWGDAWLGDYGSSVPLGKVESCYTGGTPAFQCSDLVPAREPLRCDLAGLAVSLLVQLGALRLEDAACVGWPIAALQAALARVEDAQLRQELAAMLE
jgi:serine/threonine protein kinase